MSIKKFVSDIKKSSMVILNDPIEDYSRTIEESGTCSEVMVVFPDKIKKFYGDIIKTRTDSTVFITIDGDEIIINNNYIVMARVVHYTILKHVDSSLKYLYIISSSKLSFVFKTQKEIAVRRVLFANNKILDVVEVNFS